MCALRNTNVLQLTIFYAQYGDALTGHIRENLMAKRPVVIDLEHEQETNRSLVKHMLGATNLSASKLAKRAGLAPSTLNRFLNKPVQHNLSKNTMLALTKATLSHVSYKGGDLTNEQVDHLKPLFPMFQLLSAKLQKEDPENSAPVVNLVNAFAEAHSARFEEAIINSLKSDRIQEKFTDEEIESIAKAGVGRLTKFGSIADEHALIGAYADVLKKRYPDGEPRIPSIEQDKIPLLMFEKTGIDIPNGVFDSATAQVARPAFMQGDETAFALQIYTLVMAPKFEIGDIIFASNTGPDPRKAKGIDVVVHTAEDGFLVGRLSLFDEEYVNIFYLNNSAETLRIPLSDVLSINPIKGAIFASTRP